MQSQTLWAHGLATTTWLAHVRAEKDERCGQAASENVRPPRRTHYLCAVRTRFSGESLERTGERRRRMCSSR